MSLTRLLILLVLALTTASAVLLVRRHGAVIESYLNPPIAKVEIDGEWLRLTAAEFQPILAEYVGTGFFNLDLDEVGARLEGLRWVETAVVGRRWPDTLSARITEQNIIARWGDSQLITQRGEVVESENYEVHANLPLLRGPPDSHYEVMRQYQRFNQILYPQGLRLSGLSASPRQSWRLQLNGNTEVMLGGEDLMDRLRRYVDFYRAQSEAEQNRHELADLRYGSQFSIRLRAADAPGIDTGSRK